jgi:hypothetical protein
MKNKIISLIFLLVSAFTNLSADDINTTSITDIENNITIKSSQAKFQTDLNLSEGSNNIVRKDSSGKKYFTMTVDNADMVELYESIFQGISMMMLGGNTSSANFDNWDKTSYIQLLHFIFLLGVFITFLQGAISPASGDASGKSAFGPIVKYMFFGVAVLQITYASVTTLVIQTYEITDYCDTTSSQRYEAQVELPYIVAYAFSTFNYVGRELTNLAEQAFTPIGDGMDNTTLTKSNGYMGSLRSAIKILSQDPAKVLAQNNNNDNDVNFVGVLGKMYTDCFYVPLANKDGGQKVIKDLERSSNIEDTMAKYLDETGNKVDEKYDGIMIKDFMVEWNGKTMMCGGSDSNTSLYALAKKEVFEKYKNNTSLCALKALPGAYSILHPNGNSVVTSDLSSVSLQAALINSLEKSKSNMGIGVSGVDYASGKSKADFAQTSMGTGVYMADMLPYMQATMRAVIYAFFPFIFIMLFFPGGLGILKNYIQTVIWIELWTPVASILNLIMTLKVRSDVGHQIDSTTSDLGLSFMNSVDILSDASTVAGQAGYLYAMVPALTWMILKGSGEMLGSISSSIAGGMNTNLQSDSINRDAKSLGETQALNAQRKRDGLQQFSMAEAQHYTAVRQGRDAGASMGVQSAHSTESNDILAMKQKEENLQNIDNIMSSGTGAIDEVINANAATQTKNELTNNEEYKNLDLKDSDGNLDAEKMNNLTQKLGTSKAGEVLGKSEVVSNMLSDMGMENTSKNRKNLAKVLATNAGHTGFKNNKEIMSTVKQQMKVGGFKNSTDALSHMADIAATGTAIKTKVDDNILNNFNPNEQVKINTKKDKIEKLAIQKQQTSAEEIADAKAYATDKDAYKAKNLIKSGMSSERAARIEAGEELVNKMASEGMQKNYTNEERAAIKEYTEAVNHETGKNTKENFGASVAGKLKSWEEQRNLHATDAKSSRMSAKFAGDVDGVSNYVDTKAKHQVITTLGTGKMITGQAIKELEQTIGGYMRGEVSQDFLDNDTKNELVDKSDLVKDKNGHYVQSRVKDENGKWKTLSGDDITKLKKDGFSYDAENSQWKNKDGKTIASKEQALSNLEKIKRLEETGATINMTNSEGKYTATVTKDGKIVNSITKGGFLREGAFSHISADQLENLGFSHEEAVNIVEEGAGVGKSMSSLNSGALAVAGGGVIGKSAQKMLQNKGDKLLMTQEKKMLNHVNKKIKSGKLNPSELKEMNKMKTTLEKSILDRTKTINKRNNKIMSETDTKLKSKKLSSGDKSKARKAVSKVLGGKKKLKAGATAAIAAATGVFISENKNVDTDVINDYVQGLMDTGFGISSAIGGTISKIGGEILGSETLSNIGDDLIDDGMNDLNKGSAHAEKIYNKATDGITWEIVQESAKSMFGMETKYEKDLKKFNK